MDKIPSPVIGLSQEDEKLGKENPCSLEVPELFDGFIHHFQANEQPAEEESQNTIFRALTHIIPVQVQGLLRVGHGKVERFQPLQEDGIPGSL
jgi:hypothetical protein